jgi:hypothetical protein
VIAFVSRFKPDEELRHIGAVDTAVGIEVGDVGSPARLALSALGKDR